MGIENHNAIIATTWDEEEVKRIKEWVNSIRPDSKSLFLIGPKVTNGQTTIIMVPDGSKEGWPESNTGDVLRADFIIKLNVGNYDDGSSPRKYIEVGYGEFGQKVLQGNCKNCYDDREYVV